MFENQIRRLTELGVLPLDDAGDANSIGWSSGTAWRFDLSRGYKTNKQ